VQKYTWKNRVYVGGIRPTWYQVTEAQAKELAALHQVHDDPRSHPLFQIMDDDEKAQVEQDETTSYLAAFGAASATVSLPRDVAPPPTHDIRGEDDSEAGGRAAAVPAPRKTTRKTTKTASTKKGKSGAITTADVPRGSRESKGRKK
jgi:hypothetical protein